MIGRVVAFAALFVGCAEPLASRMCVRNTDAATLAPSIVAAAKDRAESYAVQVIDHGLGNDGDRLQRLVARQLVQNGFSVRDAAESDRFLRVTLDPRQMFVELLDRRTRKLVSVRELDFDYDCH